MNAPPPLPPAASRSDQIVDAFAQRDREPPAAPPPPKSGMSGCAIAAIIGAVGLVVGVFLIGMLAAIALPAYQQYLGRARVQEAYVIAGSLQPAIETYLAQHGTCPDNAGIGYGEDEILPLGGAEGRADGNHALLKVGALDDGHCAIELRFRNISPVIDDKTLVLQADEGGWTCFDGTLGQQQRPMPCRTHDNDASTETDP